MSWDQLPDGREGSRRRSSSNDDYVNEGLFVPPKGTPRQRTFEGQTPYCSEFARCFPVHNKNPKE